MLGFYVPPTAKVIRRRDLGLKSHPKDWRSPGSNSRPLVYKAGGLTTTPWRLLVSLTKLLLHFILEKRYVLIELPLVLFKIATQIHFIYHVQAQTIGLQLS